MQRVLPISPGTLLYDGALLEAAEDLLLAGVRQLLVREPMWPPSCFHALLPELGEMDSLVLHECCGNAEVLALQYGCGLHLSSRTPVRGVRERFDGLLGVSTHDRDSLLQAEDAGADYALLSPVYTPYSKPGDTKDTTGCVRCGGGGLRGLYTRLFPWRNR